MNLHAHVGTGRAHVDELGIAYESAGTGDPTVIFIPGVFQDRTYFAPLMTQLVRRRHVVALDLRGQGESDSPEEVSIEDFAADVIAVVDDAGLGDVVLCGHSMGGPVALAVAAARPELVRGIVMLDGVILFPEAIRRQALENLVPALSGDHWLDALRGYFGRILDPNDPPDLSARVMAELGQARPGLARSFVASVFASDYADALKQVQCPLLYIHGKTPADLERLVELRPDAVVAPVAGSGHYLMLSAPERVSALIDGFLDTDAVATQPS